MQIISKLSLGVAIGVIGLSACKSKNEAIDLKSFDDQAYFESLRSDVYKSKTSKQTDIEALSDLLPETLNLTFDDISYSDKSGATTLSDVNLTVVDSDFGINIETLLLWDVNETAISDRISGKNLDSDVSLLGRIEARNLSVFGLETAFQPLIDASNDLNQKLLEDTIGGDASLEQLIDKYDISLESFIATDVKVHPWVLNLTQSPFTEDEEATEETEVWHFLQKMAAWNHAISVEDMAAYDGTFEIEMRQDDLPMSFDMNIGLIGYKGYSRGDMEYVVARDMNYMMDMVVPLDDSSTTQSMKMKTSTESYTYEKMYLSQVMKHLAIGKMPDRNQTDFMSLGIWQGNDTQVSIDDQNLYSVDRFKLDMSEFHGLLPEVFDLEIDNLKYSVTGFMSWMDGFGADLYQTANQKAEMQEGIAQITEILSKHDMTEPSFDLQFAMHWDAETGTSDLGYGFGIDDIGRFKSSFEGIMPSYDAVMDVLPEDMDDFDPSALESLFEETIFFERFSNELSDEGFDTLMAIAIDFSKLTPDDPQFAILKNATPRQLRQMIVGGISLGASQMGEVFPPALDHVEAVTDFFTEGGTLKIDFEAKRPMSAEDMDNLSPEIMTDPDKFEDVFKLDVVHEAGE